jgi:hypothetical protein
VTGSNVLGKKRIQCSPVRSSGSVPRGLLQKTNDKGFVTDGGGHFLKIIIHYIQKSKSVECNFYNISGSLGLLLRQVYGLPPCCNAAVRTNWVNGRT